MLVLAIVVTTTAPARAQPAERTRSSYVSAGLDTAVLGASRGERGDLAYYMLMTVRMHFGISRYVSMSVGAGLPLLQLMAAGASSKGGAGAVEIATFALGANLPVELRLTPQGRDRDGGMVVLGSAPVITTARVCTLGGECEGKKPLALVYGYTAHAGGGYQWRSGSFVQASYAMGYLWAGGHPGGEPAIGGMYRGGMLTIGGVFK